MNMISRRSLLAVTCAPLAKAAYSGAIIDVHQHTNYSGRPDDNLLAHQKRMGVSKTVLLPAGSRYGLAVDAGGNDTVVALARKHPDAFAFFANELPDVRETRKVIEKYLRLGAIGIGEQKFPVQCDSRPMQLIAQIARDYDVPVLMHFQHQTYNLGFERFYRMVERYPTVNFIGHAQTWWGNIDKHHQQAVLYPKTPVTAGGITDRLLSEYPNTFGDLSAGSGLNALLRDEDHARDFLKRHQNKLLYGSDCNDREGAGKPCSGEQLLTALRRLSPDGPAIEKILYRNSARLFRIA